ncbi:MAG: hypothetical protein GC162_10835 [Planctomycetes bacterium]|nr:hypothetical protein [Planctomycetota bacterium]
MPNPIEQDVKINYDGQGMDRAVNDQTRLKEEVKDSGEAAKETTRDNEQLSQATAQTSAVTKDASREAERLAASTRVVGDETERTAEKTGLWSRIVEGATTQVTGLASVFIGGFGINALLERYNSMLEENNRLLEENAEKTRRAADARLDLVALSGFESPEDIAFLDEASSLSGRSQSEVARAQTLITSRFPNASKEQIQQLVMLTAAQGQITEAPLTSLADPLGTLFNATKDPVKASNLLNEAIKQAGEPDPAKLGPLIGKFNSIGSAVGGLDAGESTGMVAAVTGLDIPNDQATTGLARLVIALRGAGTPDGRKILSREGITGDDLIGSIKQITAAYRAGKISRAELEQIGGAEALPIIAKLTDPQIEKDFFAKVGAVNAAEDRTDLIIEQNTRSGLSGDIQRLNLLAKQEEAKTAAIQSSDVNAIERDAARATMIRVLNEAQRRGEITPYYVNQAIEGFDRSMSVDSTSAEAIHGALTEAEMNTSQFGIRPAINLEDRVNESLKRGPRYINMQDLKPTNITVHTGDNYNLVHPDGTTHQTERPGRDDLP